MFPPPTSSTWRASWGVRRSNEIHISLFSGGLSHWRVRNIRGSVVASVHTRWLGLTVSSMPADQLDRSSQVLTRETFFRIMELSNKQTWLRSRQGALSELIAECENDQETLLIIDLLDRFTYLSADAIQEAAGAIRTDLIEQVGLLPTNAMLVARDRSGVSDGSHSFLYVLRTAFADIDGWSQPNFVTDWSRAIRDCPSRPNLVLVDDFIGTGGTLKRAVLKLRAEISKAHPSLAANVSISLVALAGMESGIALLKNEGIRCRVQYILRRGIRDSYDSNATPSAVDTMTRMEDRLEQRVDGERLPRFGWGEAEALIGLDLGNTPNSVFPVFWWPQRIPRRQRKPLLRRQR